MGLREYESCRRLCLLIEITRDRAKNRCKGVLGCKAAAHAVVGPHIVNPQIVDLAR